MGQKFFISFNLADCTKAHWIAWTLLVSPPADVTASGGGVAIGGSVSGSTITTGGAANTAAPKPK